MNASWNKQILLLVVISVGISITGIVSGQKVIFSALFAPVIFVVFLSYMERDIELSIAFDLPSFMKVGQEATLLARIDVKKGYGFVNMELPIYKEMEILEGTNVHVLFKGLNRREVEFRYTVKATRRGIFDWTDANIQYMPVIGTKRKKDITFKVGHKLEVNPEISFLKKSQFELRSKRKRPQNSIARSGPPTHEFETIREYQPGDPFKSINWKSSARNLHRQSLMVNVYEKEGLKNFIFIIDTSPFMASGTAEENPLEYSIRLVMSGAKYLLSKNYNVGFWPLRSGLMKRSEFVIPSSGMETFNQIHKSLLIMEHRKVVDVFMTLERNLARIAMETRPMIMIFTSLERGNIKRIRDFTSQVSKYRISPIIVDIRAEGIMAKNIDPRLSKAYSYKNLSDNKSIVSLSGTRVIKWDPVNQSMGGVAYLLAMEGGW